MRALRQRRCFDYVADELAAQEMLVKNWAQDVRAQKTNVSA
jgi:hypothetical protein